MHLYRLFEQLQLPQNIFGPDGIYGYQNIGFDSHKLLILSRLPHRAAALVNVAPAFVASQIRGGITLQELFLRH
jgi:hypothetical protein